MCNEGFIPQEVKETHLSDDGLKELCEGGFFVPSDLDEGNIVSQILDHEREKEFLIIILPHENCNFRCVYCYETFERGKMEPDIIVGLKAFAGRKAKETRCLSISWFGGEPLLARNVIYELSDSFMDSCERNGTLYKSSMTTNGYFLTPDVVDLLLQRKVNHFQVTLDGPETVHNRTRKLAGGGGTYRKILDNLTEMRYRDDKFSVRIRVNFNEDNAPFMEQHLSELSALFRDDPRFYVAFNTIGQWGGPNDSTFDVCDNESASRIYLQLAEKTLKSGFSDQIIKGLLTSHSNACYAARESSIIVSSDGTVYKCTVAFEDSHNHVGTLTKDGQLLIDQSRQNLWTGFNDKNTSKCTSCTFFSACQSRHCPLVAMDQNEPPCPFTKTEYESMVKLAASRPKV
jgi:uncharacterized protein